MIIDLRRGFEVIRRYNQETDLFNKDFILNIEMASEERLPPKVKDDSTRVILAFVERTNRRLKREAGAV